MDIEVDVLISHENKTLKASLNIDTQDWQFCPIESVKDGLALIGVDVDRISNEREVKYDWGEIVADMTHTLGDLGEASAWMTMTMANTTATDPQSLMLSNLYRSFPVLNTCKPCPICSLDENEPIDMVLSALIPHLNDNHKWTREEIADWVEAFSEEIGISHD